MNDQVCREKAGLVKRSIFLSIKYFEDCRNREFIDGFMDGLAIEGVSGYCIAKDLEGWGSHQFLPDKLMADTFVAISKSDALVVDFAEKGVGIGIEVGYATAIGLPVLVMAPTGTDISATLTGVAKAIFFYTDVGDAIKLVADYIKTVPELVQ